MIVAPIIRNLSFITNNRFITLLYHSVSNNSLPHIKNLYKVRSIKGFQEDLDQVLKIYEPVSLAQVLEKIENGKTFNKPSFLITFDDGLKECYQHVAPILKEKGIPAIFFINTSFIDNKELFYKFKISLLIEKYRKEKKNKNDVNVFRNSLFKYDHKNKDELDNLALKMGVDFKYFLKEKEPYLSIEQIKKMIDWGFDIGSHGIDHTIFSSLNLNLQIQQVFESLGELERNFNFSSKVFAFPFTDEGVSKDFFEKVYLLGLKLSFGTAGIKNDIFIRNIQRIPMENYANANSALTYQYLYFLLKKPLGKNIIKRK